MLTKEKILVSYLRHKNGERFGVVVAIDRGRLGWSLCCPKDRFNKELGLKIAIGRAQYYLPMDDWQVTYFDKKVKTKIPFFAGISPSLYPKEEYGTPRFVFKDKTIGEKLPKVLLTELLRMYDRSCRYFK
jgi:hypothetical protein